MTKVSEQILKNGELQFKAFKLRQEYGLGNTEKVPELLEVRNE